MIGEKASFRFTFGLTVFGSIRILLAVAVEDATFTKYKLRGWYTLSSKFESKTPHESTFAKGL